MSERYGTQAGRTAVIADDHPLIRESIRRILEDMDAKIVAEVGNGIDAVSAAREHRPNLVVLDLVMPFAQGTEVYLEVRRHSPESRIAVLTAMTSSRLLGDLMQSGVDGLFLKRGDPENLKRGLWLVMEGGKYVASDVIALLEKRPVPSPLSARERQTLSLVAQGFTNAEIGNRLNLSSKTIEKHRASMMAKLGVHSMSELLAHALREGLLDPASQL